MRHNGDNFLSVHRRAAAAAAARPVPSRKQGPDVIIHKRRSPRLHLLQTLLFDGPLPPPLPLHRADLPLAEQMRLHGRESRCTGAKLVLAYCLRSVGGSVQVRGEYVRELHEVVAEVAG